MLDGKYGREERIAIPGPVLDRYRRYRPTPLCRARAFERAIGYPGRILFKREDCNPTGSHKPNTAIPQAFYGKKQGLRRLVTDTGAGQWGAALALACRSLEMDCTVFMTRNSYEDKPYRRFLMELAGAVVHPSPSAITERGRRLLKKGEGKRGSLGIGMGEAMELMAGDPESRLALGCMSYYAALHQTVVGLELADQLEMAGSKPGVLIACVGGGTNLIGFMSTYIRSALLGGDAPRMVAAESANVPVLTKGEYRYDYADFFRQTPMILMYTLGHSFIPPEVHSGGLRYHGKSPILSLLVHKGMIDPVAISQEEAFSAGRRFFEAESIVPAPESSHAIAATIREAVRLREEGRSPDLVFCLSGTGYLDLQGYARVFEL